MRRWLPLLCFAAVGSPALGRLADFCTPGLATLVGPAYGITSRSFVHTLKDEGPVTLNLTTQRVRASNGTEVVQFRVWRPGGEEPVAELTFQFNSPTEGQFRGIEVAIPRSGLGAVLYQELASYPEFQSIRTVKSKYVDDNDSGMQASLRAAGIAGPYDATPQQLFDASQRIDPKTGKPFVPATNLWEKVGFRTSKVVYDKTESTIRVEYERKHGH